MAPMEDVTDIAFRQMFAKYSKANPSNFLEKQSFVTFTEFVSADGLALAPKDGKKQLLSNFKYEENERPIVAQIFGRNPKHIKDASEIIFSLGFDGVDINMGCPVENIIKQGAGSALIKTPDLACEIIRAAKVGANNGSGHSIPVSVKTRIGYNDISLEWIAMVLSEMPSALTVHLRTRKEMSNHPPHWELSSQIIKLRDEISPETLIIGNGNVKSLRDGKDKAKKYGCDGVMIGRALFGKPYFFSNRACQHTSEKDKLKMLLEHIKLFDKYLLRQNFKSYHVMKKHFKAYVQGFSGAKELRTELMGTNTKEEAQKIIKDYLL